MDLHDVRFGQLRDRLRLLLDPGAKLRVSRTGSEKLQGDGPVLAGVFGFVELGRSGAGDQPLQLIVPEGATGP